MKRIVLTDNTGRWFDAEKATHFEEDTRWNGSNHISLATGSQWDHESLWRTAGGQWVLHHWSQWQGSRPSWTLFDDDLAARWLVINGHESPIVAGEIAALELA